MGSDLREGDLDLPATEIPGADLEHRDVLVGAEEGEGLPFDGGAAQVAVDMERPPRAVLILPWLEATAEAAA